jgi:branched-chain amino acid transport system permease protein
MVVTGGKGTLAGPVVGGIIFGILPEVLREFARPEVQWIIYGAIMILIIFFLPDGIVPALQSWWKGIRSPESEAVGPEVAPAQGQGGGGNAGP